MTTSRMVHGDCTNVLDMACQNKTASCISRIRLRTGLLILMICHICGPIAIDEQVPMIAASPVCTLTDC
uniref:Uncharacterized protein n=1 Tax=Setaria italica TaxID=4555 RepID=K3Y0N5_SETIT